MNQNNILIFTDLDGSLLNHNNFEFNTIKPFILKCLRNNIRIIPNTSKTKNEVEFFSEQLGVDIPYICLLYTSPSPRDKRQSRMPSSA